MKAKITSSPRTVFIKCAYPEKGCQMRNISKKLKNIRFTKTVYPGENVYSFNVKGDDAQQIADEMPILVSFIEQVCALCQKQR